MALVRWTCSHPARTWRCVADEVLGGVDTPSPRADGSALEAADRRAPLGKALDASHGLVWIEVARGPPAAARAAGTARAVAGEIDEAGSPRRRSPGAAARPGCAPVRPHRRDRGLGGAGPRAARPGAYLGLAETKWRSGGRSGSALPKRKDGQFTSSCAGPAERGRGARRIRGARSPSPLPALLRGVGAFRRSVHHRTALFAPAAGVPKITVGALRCLAGLRRAVSGRGRAAMNASRPRWVATGHTFLAIHPTSVHCRARRAVHGFRAASGSWARRRASVASSWCSYEAAGCAAPLRQHLPRPLLSLPSTPRIRCARHAPPPLPSSRCPGSSCTARRAPRAAPDASPSWLPFGAETSGHRRGGALHCSTSRPSPPPPSSRAARGRRAKAPGCRALLAMAVVFPLYFLLPRRAGRAPSLRAARLGLASAPGARRNDTIAAASRPSTVWALLAADAWAGFINKAAGSASRGPGLVRPELLLHGMHSILDGRGRCAGGVFRGSRATLIWEALRRVAGVSHPWTEWRIGPVGSSARALGCPREYRRAVDRPLRWPARAAGPRLRTPRGFWALSSGAATRRPQGRCAPSGSTAACSAYGWPHRRRLSSVWRRPDALQLLAGYCAAAPFLQAIGARACLVPGCCTARPRRGRWESATTFRFRASRRRGSRAFRCIHARSTPSSGTHRGRSW